MFVQDRNKLQVPSLSKLLGLFKVQLFPLPSFLVQLVCVFNLAVEVKEDYVCVRQLVYVILDVRADMFASAPPFTRNVLDLFI